MEWTGYLYAFYSNESISKVFEKFTKAIDSLGYKHQESIEFDEHILFCYKDEQTLSYHLENGYNTDINGEGCFSIESKHTDLEGVASLFEFKGESDFDPMNIYLRINSIYYYRIILPEKIDDSVFSKKIFELFGLALKA